jgi:hypothetical protein
VKKVAEFFSDLRNLVVAIGTLLGLVVVAIVMIKRGVVLNPLGNSVDALTVENLTLSKVTEINSGELDRIKGLCYAFDATGNRLDYKRRPSRPGYVVEYSGMAQGIGNVEVDYWVQDLQSTNMLTGSTKVEAEAVIKSEPIHCAFFFQKTPASPKERVAISVVALPTAGSDLDKAIDTVPLDLSFNEYSAVRLALK